VPLLGAEIVSYPLPVKLSYCSCELAGHNDEGIERQIKSDRRRTKSDEGDWNL